MMLAILVNLKTLGYGHKMQKIFDMLNRKIQTPCDINEHLKTLYEYAKGCEHITEFGTREITATWSFLAAQPKTFVGVDIYESSNLPYALGLAKENGIDFQWVHHSTLEPGYLIEETDFLFIDTAHTYGQLAAELERHGNQAKKYIGFHDTTTFGQVNEAPYEANRAFEEAIPATAPKGLVPAIDEFLDKNPQWERVAVFTNNNGLTILQRK
jgi:hypothetical protein